MQTQLCDSSKLFLISQIDLTHLYIFPPHPQTGQLRSVSENFLNFVLVYFQYLQLSFSALDCIASQSKFTTCQDMLWYLNTMNMMGPHYPRALGSECNTSYVAPTKNLMQSSIFHRAKLPLLYTFPV